ncbi:hypothetical protein [Nocardia implantans]|uniref:Uncharacterized protein n=1 Tax=Nocardia implantans TaxID=3108168 RepID=A0ABU6AWV0_9NOCA|nr:MULTISPECIES: hypothetical protein [unclassified Nocardia]MBF6193879.1 hypothetical protein [Nocardia beijingensis]MEA3529382.1 hypothetical protein [Nocardia sp. CDC192]MEB3511968.1 hypothetical protein [Nocardia sp. CDC186]
MRSVKLSVALAREVSLARTQVATGWLRGTPFGRTLRRVMDGLAEIQLVDRSLALAAQIFTSVLPVMIAASVFSGWHAPAETINDQFGFDSAAVSADGGSLTANPAIAAFGAVGLLMVLLGGTSFARALARMYEAVWKVPAIGPREAWRWLAALLAVALAAGLVGQIRDLTQIRYAGRLLALLGEVVIWMFVWMLAPFLLTKGALTGRLLWVSGALTAIGLTAVHAAGRVLLPRITTNAREHFGPLGLAFTSVSWLFVLSVVIVGAAAIVKALALDETAIGHYLRGQADDDRE